jgi:hypothetical protein
VWSVNGGARKNAEGLRVKYERERAHFPLLLNEWNLLTVGVEVGVCQGIHASIILSMWPGFLHLVDPWAKIDGYEEPYEHEKNYEATFQRLTEYEGRFEMHRTTSLAASEQFRDESLDFVYVDANHRYEAVRDDLNAWWPKVRQGGMLAGDDYGLIDEQWVDFGHGKMRFGVKRAVDEFAKKVRRNISLDILADWSNMLPDRTQVRARGWYFLK